MSSGSGVSVSLATYDGITKIAAGELRSNYGYVHHHAPPIVSLRQIKWCPVASICGGIHRNGIAALSVCRKAHVKVTCRLVERTQLFAIVSESLDTEQPDLKWLLNMNLKVSLQSKREFDEVQVQVEASKCGATKHSLTRPQYEVK